MATEKRAADLESIGILLHVPLHLSVSLGNCTMPIADLLKLGTGSIVELDRDIDRPVELLVNGRPIARGEIVAVENAFGLRITELIA
ncbi:MAG: flagellar motor switch protein FliN [Candidatus Eremiobacteraeota bacterium]|nr:flagellar motor switch protein FliN [Candidatus Eremiobacteraeota bacterium]